VLAAFVLVLEGPVQLDDFFRGFLRGVYGFATFCFLVAVLVIPLGPLAAFLIALCGAVLAQALARTISPGRDAQAEVTPAATGSSATGSARANL
jgi:hypothetical protein